MNTEARNETGIALGGLIALAAAMGVGRFVYTPILPFMVDDLGLSAPAAGVIASANFLGYLLGAVAASKGALPGGRRAWFLTGLALSAVTTGAMGFTDSMAAFMALRLIGGMASAFVLVFSSALVLDRLAAAGRSGLSAVHFAGVGVGIAVSAVLVAALASFGWRAQWLASGAVSLLALGAAAWLVPRGLPAEAPPDTQPTDGMDRRLAALTVAYGLFGFGYVITATFISTMVRAEPSLRVIEPVVWLVVGLAAIPSVALWAWVGRRWGNDRGFALACLVEAAGVAISVLFADAAAVLVAAALLGGTFMGITALGLMLARSLAAGDPRRMMALMTAAFGLGQMIGPTFAGVVHDLGGGFTGPSLAAAAALIVAAALVANRGIRGGT